MEALQHSKDDVVNHLSRATLCVALAPIAGLLVACADANTARSPAAKVSTRHAMRCQLTNITGVRSHGKRMTRAELGKTASTWVLAHRDSRSFVVKVTARDLTNAGINTSDMKQNRPLVLVVNHGTFDESMLPVSIGPGGVPASANPTPSSGGTAATTGATANWVLYALDPATMQPVLWQVALDGPCFNGG